MTTLKMYCVVDSVSRVVNENKHLTGWKCCIRQHGGAQEIGFLANLYPIFIGSDAPPMQASDHVTVTFELEDKS
jgi:hypothetical protein